MTSGVDGGGPAAQVDEATADGTVEDDRPNRHHKETDMITSKPVELGTATEDTKEGGFESVDNPQHTQGYPKL